MAAPAARNDRYSWMLPLRHWLANVSHQPAAVMANLSGDNGPRLTRARLLTLPQSLPGADFKAKTNSKLHLQTSAHEVDRPVAGRPLRRRRLRVERAAEL